MPRLMLFSTARQLSRQGSPRAAVSAFSPSKPAWSSSASFCDSASPRPVLPAHITPQNAHIIRNSTARPLLSPHAFSRRSRPFSSSAIRPAAKVAQNPKNGEDGNPLMVNISDRAAERLREITDPTSSPSATKEENPYHHLRITVTSGGCHGFQYMMALEPASKIDAEEDTVFEAEAEDGAAGGPGEAKIVMDEPSLELLSGSTVDYTMELIGSQFKIVDNPRASSNCGCGTSFDVND